ncbi:hypothetical protein QBC35DRAFT_175445 [Podospora australis]|uniref:Uncharacterized protein n=1 Tax=Podospora australis TaxID=1536484 RepID=A0AAN6WX76_9PEZI|nr:hypothetical protein QBC35DRAFT_175445 [Podospora australis]
MELQYRSAPVTIGSTSTSAENRLAYRNGCNCSSCFYFMPKNDGTTGMKKAQHNGTKKHEAKLCVSRVSRHNQILFDYALLDCYCTVKNRASLITTHFHFFGSWAMTKSPLILSHVPKFPGTFKSSQLTVPWNGPPAAQNNSHPTDIAPPQNGAVVTGSSARTPDSVDSPAIELAPYPRRSKAVTSTMSSSERQQQPPRRRRHSRIERRLRNSSISRETSAIIEPINRRENNPTTDAIAESYGTRPLSTGRRLPALTEKPPQSWLSQDCDALWRQYWD